MHCFNGRLQSSQISLQLFSADKTCLNFSSNLGITLQSPSQPFRRHRNDRGHVSLQTQHKRNSRLVFKLPRKYTYYLPRIFHCSEFSEQQCLCESVDYYRGPGEIARHYSTHNWSLWHPGPGLDAYAWRNCSQWKLEPRRRDADEDCCSCGRSGIRSRYGCSCFVIVSSFSTTYLTKSRAVLNVPSILRYNLH